jgi:hypothetical protein
LLQLDGEQKGRTIREEIATFTLPMHERLEIQLGKRARALERAAIVTHKELVVDAKDVCLDASVSQQESIY